MADTERPKILVTRPDIPVEGMQVLEASCDVETYDKQKPMPKADLIRAIAGKDGILCNVCDVIDIEVLEAAGEQLKVVSTMSAGFQHIDIEACNHRQITICNTAGMLTEAVAEWTVLLMLAVSRYLPNEAVALHAGNWFDFRPYSYCGKGLEDAVIGFVGMADVGLATLKRVVAFNVKQVLVYNTLETTAVKAARRLGAIDAEFKDLLEKSDFIVCLLHLNDQSRDLFNVSMFNLMKPSAVLINTGRAGVINQHDLYDALKNRKIRAAALDVIAPEPMHRSDPLLTLDNIIITPHLGGALYSVRIRQAETAAHNIVNIVSGREPISTIPRVLKEYETE